MRRLLPLLIAPFLLQSCCAGHSVTLKNTSGEDKVVTICGRRFANAHTFVLPRDKKVLVERGLGFPDMDQLVIVDNTDTIRMRGDERTRIKERRIDFFFTVTVEVRSLSDIRRGD